MMKVLIVGGGGREHALAWKAAQSALVECVYVAPGNAGTAREPRVKNIAIAAEDIHALAHFAEQQRIDLTIIGPEAPLVMGVADVFAQRGLTCFGPRRAAAQLEGSKTFAKDFLQRHAIPSAAYRSFAVAVDAIAYLDSLAYPVVIKADGLAAGKGVVIAEDARHATNAITDMLTKNRYGDAGSRVVIEEFLDGEEASFICIVDGEELLPMASSQDHKAAHDGDTGPNTGGMGAYSPAPVADDVMHARIVETVIRPTVAGLAAEGIPYTGFLYAGLIIGADRIPKVLEFNCRFGDPETQPIMLRLRSDLVAHCLAATRGELNAERARWDHRCALGVVIASAGYPGDYEKNIPIEGLDEDALAQAARKADGKIFHAGTALKNGKTLATGGRVLCATAIGDTARAAQTAAYNLARRIKWRGCWYRTDIGYRAIAREDRAGNQQQKETEVPELKIDHQNTADRSNRATSKLPFWGIDGCSGGWLCIGLGNADKFCHFTTADICEVYERLQEKAKIVLIDIPIGLSDDADERDCDKSARKYIGKRRSSVFRVPCRQAIEAYRDAPDGEKEKAGKIASVQVTGGCLSKQTWGIVPKIDDVDFFLCKNKTTRKLFRETHPEVCFRALNNDPLYHSKKKPDGLEERRKILTEHYPDTKQIFDEIRGAQHYKNKVADDDIYDALVMAATAKIGYGKYRTLPEKPLLDHHCGLPMEMVYFNPALT